jgi:hypothetical protein
VANRVNDHGLGPGVEAIKDPVDANAKRTESGEVAEQGFAPQRLLRERQDRGVNGRRVVGGEA